MSLVDTTTEIPDEMSGLIEHAEALAKLEVREDLGRALQEMPEQWIQDCLPEGTTLTSDIVIGVRLSASLVGDKTWDY